MKELSLNILDIAENSVRAGATLIAISIVEDGTKLSFGVTDNGCGMKQEFLKTVRDPFSTTRTTRKVGLGIPLLQMEAEMTGGTLTLESHCKEEYPDMPSGTFIQAIFIKNSIDYIPLGDIISTITTLIQGSPDIDFSFSHQMPNGCVSLDTREMREVLGPDVMLNDPAVLVWIHSYLDEAYGENK